jgi:hypothetical protein
VRDVAPGPSRSPPHVSPRSQRPLARTLQAPRRHSAADAPASARDRHGRSAGLLHASSRNATCSPARRRPPQWGSARSQDCASPSACAAPRRRMSPPPTPAHQHAGFTLAAMPRLPGIPAPLPASSRPKDPPTSCRPPLRTDTRSGISPVYPTRSCSSGSSTPQTTGSATPTTPALGATTPRGSVAW